MAVQLEVEIIALTSGLQIIQPPTVGWMLLQQLLPLALLCQQHTCWLWWDSAYCLYFKGWVLMYGKDQRLSYAGGLRKVFSFPWVKSSGYWSCRVWRSVQNVPLCMGLVSSWVVVKGIYLSVGWSAQPQTSCGAAPLFYRGKEIWVLNAIRSQWVMCT